MSTLHFSLWNLYYNSFLQYLKKLFAVEHCPEILLVSYSKTALSILEIQYQLNIITSVYLIREKCNPVHVMTDMTALQYSLCYENITE